MTTSDCSRWAARNAAYPRSVCGVAAMKRFESKAWCVLTRSTPSRPMAAKSAGTAGRMAMAELADAPALPNAATGEASRRRTVR
jgi:hypothetical protein